MTRRRRQFTTPVFPPGSRKKRSDATLPEDALSDFALIVVFFSPVFFFCLDGWQAANAARRLQALAARTGWQNTLVKVTNLTVLAVQTDQNPFVDMLEAALWHMTANPGDFPQTAVVRAHLSTVLTLATSARQRRSEDRQDKAEQSLVELRRVLMVLVQLVPPSDVASNPVLAAALESHLATPLADASSLQTPSNTITAGGENAEESK